VYRPNTATEAECEAEQPVTAILKFSNFCRELKSGTSVTL